MIKYIPLFICIHFSVNLNAQEIEHFDSVRIFGGILGYNDTFSESKSTIFNKDFEVFKEKKRILDEYFKMRSIGEIRGASRLIHKDSELRKLVGDGDSFTTVANVYIKHRTRELNLNYKSGIEGCQKNDSVLFDRNFWAPRMLYFFSTKELSERMEVDDSFIREQTIKDSLKVYSGSGFKRVIIPSGVYTIEAKFIGYLVPYYVKAFELIALKPEVR